MYSVYYEDDSLPDDTVSLARTEIVRFLHEAGNTEHWEKANLAVAPFIGSAPLPCFISPEKITFSRPNFSPEVSSRRICEIVNKD